jgi:flagellar hook protein FlgE
MHLQAQGELQRTDQPLDLAFDGDGLLLVRDKSRTLGGTRTGAFHLTKEGRLQDAKGLTLQGWPLLPENGTTESSHGTAGISSTFVPFAPPSPSAAFIGPLGALEDIQLIKEVAPIPVVETPHSYGAGFSIQKEADGLYSLHSFERGDPGDYVNNHSWGTVVIQRTLVDSLGNEHEAEMSVFWKGQLVALSFNDLSNGSNMMCYYAPEMEDGQAQRCTFDKTTKQMIISYGDTGAELRFDWSDVKISQFEHPRIATGETVPWEPSPMIVEEGILRIARELSYELNGTERDADFTLARGEDGAVTGSLKGLGFDVELYFNGEGRVSGYRFTTNSDSADDPSVGVKQTGATVKGAHHMSYESDYGTCNIDLSAVQIINRTGAGLKTANGTVIKPEALEPAAIPEESKEAFAPLSPSSVSIDENGVLKRLMDDGDWEPVYLLACCQFASMNAAEERNGVYYATPASGALRTGVSGKDGMGTITSGTLERSTTDLAHELSEMIKAQHAYAANTKVLSTLDDMLTELERL